MKKQLNIRIATALAVASSALFSGCVKSSKTPPPNEDSLAASAFALGCVTAIHVANESDKPIKGDELAVACANYWLTNSPGDISNILAIVVKKHSH